MKATKNSRGESLGNRNLNFDKVKGVSCLLLLANAANAKPMGRRTRMRVLVLRASVRCLTPEDYQGGVAGQAPSKTETLPRNPAKGVPAMWRQEAIGLTTGT